MATGLKHQCGGNPTLSLSRTQTQKKPVPRCRWRPPRTRCFTFLLDVPSPWWKGRGGDVFHLSRLLLPHIHNQNSWRLYMLLKPNSSKNTKHGSNTKGRQKKREEKRKEQTKENAPILYLMCNKLYSIYIFVMYYPPRRAKKKNLVTQKEEKKIYTLYCICHGASNMFIH